MTELLTDKAFKPHLPMQRTRVWSRMGFIELRDLTKTFGETVAVDHIDLDIEKGELLTLLGSSGCGKTTTLRMIAGFIKPDFGEVTIDGQVLSSPIKGIQVPPSKREMGMVFQSFAIWPHMNVFDNIAYGLKIKKLPKAEIQKEVQRVMEMVHLEGLEKRYPSQLSGGQQQRVCLARSLVRHPRVLLLDEPLANLDAKLREEMRFELNRLQTETGITTVYVTHDQAEAMVLSDRISVMDRGIIHQVDTPINIYEKPKTKFVADFIGLSNFIPGRITQLGDGMTVVTSRQGRMIHCRASEKIEEGRDVLVLVRPEDIEIYSNERSRMMNLFRARVVECAYLGNSRDYRFEMDEQRVRVQSLPSVAMKPGDVAYLHFKPERCLAIPA